MSGGGGTGRLAVLAALAANVGIAVAKFVAFGFTGSSAMLSEAVHSLADSANEVLLLVGGRHADRAPTVDHEFGYASVRYVYAFVVSVVLFVFGGAFALYEGWHKLAHPEPVTDPAWAFGVLGIALVLEAFSLRTALRESAAGRRGRSFRQYLRQERHPELPVVLLEDLAALSGLVLALAGLSLAVALDDGRWDGVASLLIGMVLVLVAVWLARRMTSLLIGESVLPDMRARLEAALLAEPAVRGVIHLRTMQLGPDEVLLATKIAVAPDISGAELAAAIDSAELRLREVLPDAKYLFVEPDLHR